MYFFSENIATFVALMAKYLFCIFVSVILVLSVNHTRKELLHIQADKHLSYEKACIEPCDGIFFYSGRNIFNILTPAFSREAVTGWKVPGGVFAGTSFSAERTPVKILKFNAAIRTVCLLSLFDTSASWSKGLEIYETDSSSGKSSYRYYVYTLRRILV